ncbi:MAG: hydroxymethylbilane synthase [Rickettsiales bacterium]
MKYKVGTRDSKLALRQTQLVIEALTQKNPQITLDQFEIVKIKTKGDNILNKNLSEIGGKNLFVKEIEDALLDNQIDFAVHSLKDLTGNLDPKLTIAACLEREDPRDAFVSLQYESLASLPHGSVVGTSSIRRKSIALAYHPYLVAIPFRGNVLTRLEKLKQKQVDATFLAVAGLKRLGIDQTLYTPLHTDDFLPAVSQGIIGVQCNKSDDKIINLLAHINHLETEIITRAERSFLECLNADCTTPIAAYATLNQESINLECLVINSHGKIFRENIQASSKDASKIGYEMGIKFKKHLIS